MTVENTLANGLKTSVLGSQYKTEYDENLSLLDPGRVTSGTLSGRPAAGAAQRFYYATDAQKLFYDNGTSWDEVQVNHEVQRALETAILEYVDADTVKITFPYKFSDGSTWADISKNTTQAGKTTGNIYWLGIYYDGSKVYTPTSAPAAGDISVAVSASNTTEPAQPTDGVLIRTYLRCVGDAGGDVDVTDFVDEGDCIHIHDAVLKTNLTAATATSLNGTLVDWLPPTAKKFHGHARLQNSTGTDAQLYLGPTSTLAANHKNSLTVGGATSVEGWLTIESPIKTAQTLYYKVAAGNNSRMYLGGYE
ncbi:MAG: hypothetical protein IEMM0002_0802 [bacterium]|nr:MAG: hypothetical protein IEMM0002_0802 [bacterium]